MTDYLYLDIETRSGADLKKTGVYRYAEDEKFDILMLAWAWNDDPMQTSTDPGEMRGVIRDILERHERGEDFKVIAHNTGFERVCFSSYIGMPVGSHIPPEVFEDTMVLAAWSGLPLSLKELAKAMGGELKDEAGSALIRFFCTPKKDGTFRSLEDDIQKWEAFVAYCAQDVEAMRDVHKKLNPTVTDFEVETWHVSERTNDRGVRIDVDMALAAVDMSESNKQKALDRMAELTGLPNPNSVSQLGGWLREQGLQVDSLNKAAVEGFLEQDDLPADVREVLELRQHVALSSSAKYQAELDSVSSDGRIRGTLMYYGAHTGRFSGRRLQLQNLPSEGIADDDTEVEARIIDLKLGFPTPQVDLKRMIRSSLVGPFAVVDFAQIESRVLSYLAGEQWALDAFFAEEDLYSSAAARMYDVSYEEAKAKYRKQGKIATLALGYGGSKGALKAFGAPGSDEDLMDIVYKWRNANESIVQYWRDLMTAFKEGGSVGDVSFFKEGSNRHLVLPSGRSIVYRGCTKRTEVNPFTGKEQEVIYRKDYRKKGHPTKFWPGIACENVVQAVARDILTSALVRLEREHFRVVGSVHDEVIVEANTEGDLHRIGAIMTTAPDWLPDFPLAAGASPILSRYRKAEDDWMFSNYHEPKYVGGN